MTRLYRRKTIILMLLYVATISLVVSSTIQQSAAGKSISLEDFQRILRSSLDSELEKITDEQVSTALETTSIHEKSKTLMRRRASIQNNREDVKSRGIFDRSSAIVHKSEDIIWDDIVRHTWKVADTIKRDEESSSLTRTIYDDDGTLSIPFLVCGEEHLEFNDIAASFGKLEEEAMLVSSSHKALCLILSTNSVQCREVTDSFGGSLTAVPLPDVAKIHSGTIEEVSSKGWSVPFRHVSKKSNATEMINHWERIIIVDFTPEFNGIEEESELLEIVNIITNDIQDMGEVGWYQKMEDEEKKLYSLEDSTSKIPSLSDLFSLTAIANTKDNQRTRFWQEVLKNGIESKHVCSTMFSTLFVKPRSGYYSFELVLNPMDGPPPPSKEYESSASNPNCVISFIAALSVHPYVLSVKANFPVYHGWNVAQLMDSYK